jgi:hypothetical protein
MALVTNDEPVFETPAERKVADAGTVLDDSNPVVQANPEAFHPVGPADDEGEGRTSAVAADPQLQSDQTPKAAPKAEPAEGAHHAPTSAPKSGR